MHLVESAARGGQYNGWCTVFHNAALGCAPVPCGPTHNSAAQEMAPLQSRSNVNEIMNHEHGRSTVSQVFLSWYMYPVANSLLDWLSLPRKTMLVKCIQLSFGWDCWSRGCWSLWSKQKATKLLRPSLIFLQLCNRVSDTSRSCSPGDT